MTFDMQLDKQEEDMLEAQRLRSLVRRSEFGNRQDPSSRGLLDVIRRAPMRPSRSTRAARTVCKPDSAVITPEGIVGRVIHASNFFSIVQLILDSQSARRCSRTCTRDARVSSGESVARDLDLDYIDDDNDLKEGDEFITSGMDRIYPKGLPVGVDRIDRAPRGAACSRPFESGRAPISAGSKKCFASSTAPEVGRCC